MSENGNRGDGENRNWNAVLEREWVGIGMIRWEWEGNGNKKVIPAHLYFRLNTYCRRAFLVAGPRVWKLELSHGLHPGPYDQYRVFSQRTRSLDILVQPAHWGFSDDNAP